MNCDRGSRDRLEDRNLVVINRILLIQCSSFLLSSRQQLGIILDRVGRCQVSVKVYVFLYNLSFKVDLVMLFSCVEELDGYYWIENKFLK